MKLKEILIIALFTFVTILFWIFFDVYHAKTTSSLTQTQQELIKPLNPQFEEQALLIILEKE